eukprot:229309_1
MSTAEITNSAVTKSEWNNFLWYIILIGVSTFGCSLVDGGLTILIPFYTKDILNANETYSAMLFATMSFGNFLLHPLTGIMVAHTSCELIIIIASIIHFLAQFFMYLSLLFINYSYLETNTSYYIWCIMCFIVGITQSLTFVSIEAYIALHIPISKRGRFMTYQVLVNRCAYLFGSFSNGLLSINYSIATTLLLNSIITIVFGIIVFFLFIPPYYSVSSTIQITSFQDFLNIWNKIGYKNRFKIDNWKFVNTNINKKINDNSSSLFTVCQTNLNILFKVSILCFGQLYTRKSRQFILTFQADTINMSNDKIAYVNTYSYIPDVAVFLLPGYLMDKYGRKYSLIPSLICLVIASMCLSFANNYFQLSIIAMLFGLGDGLANGSLNTIASDIAPLDYNGRAKFIGIFYMICAIPNIISPMIIGMLASNVSLFYASLSSVFFAMLSLIWTIFIVPETSTYHLMNAGETHFSDENDETVPLQEDRDD